MSPRSIIIPVMLGLGAAVGAFPADAANLTVVNASFETLPAGGLPVDCGLGCSYSGSIIPGWYTAGGGQFQPGSSSGNDAHFDYVPDGVTVGYVNAGGVLAQTLAATAVAGMTYTLTTDLGVRHDAGDPGSITLTVGLATIVATGTLPAPGQWSVYTATYTATAADAGGAIVVTLASPANQGDFDDVRVTTTIPEPASWALMLVGFGVVGSAVRRRRATAGAG